MADEVKDTVKTVGVISSLFKFLEKAVIVAFMLFMERSKIKAKKAEDKQAEAETEVKILKAHNTIDLEVKGKTDAEIVDEFLHSSKPTDK